MNSDFTDLLREFAVAEVRYLVVGGYAMIHHLRPRFTKDLDLWIEPTEQNAKRVMVALRRFGIPLVDVKPDDFAVPGLQYVVGRPPVQFDFLTSLPGLDFSRCWENRSRAELRDGVEIQVLGLDDLREAKKRAGRLRDLADLEELEGL